MTLLKSHNRSLSILKSPPHWYLTRLCQLIDLVVDVVREVGDVTLVGAEVQEVQNGAWNFTTSTPRNYNIFLSYWASEALFLLFSPVF